jgi:hypothetical protein
VPPPARTHIDSGGSTVNVLFSAAVLGLCLWCGDLRAEPTEKDAVALVERGAQFLRLNDKGELINKINTRDAEFNAGSLYLAMQGGVGYKFMNPVSGKVEPKITYVLRVGDVALEAGVYRH